MSLDTALAKQLKCIVIYTDSLNIVQFSNTKIVLSNDLRTMIMRIKYSMRYDDDYGQSLKTQYDALIEFLREFIRFKKEFPYVKLPVTPMILYNDMSFVDALNYLKEARTCLRTCIEIQEGFLTSLAGIMINQFDDFYYLDELDELLNLLEA